VSCCVALLLFVWSDSLVFCLCVASGVVWLWGFGESLYAKTAPTINPTPSVIAMRERVSRVACGQSHILLLTLSGDVYAMGSGTMGALGHGARAHCRKPRLVLRGKEIREVAAGRYHSMACNGRSAARLGSAHVRVAWMGGLTDFVCVLPALCCALLCCASVL
jgi:alpha-tubulin suppressor-like RCC1 family protein